MFPPSRLYAIVDSGLAGGPGAPAVAARERSAVAVAAQLLGAGVRILQYRHKGPFTRRSWDDCQALAELAAQHGARFFVNDRADVARLCGAAGAHLGQRDISPDAARSVLSGAQLIGFSTHNLEQARESERMPVDYVAIGPVFPTRTKEQPDPVIGLETVAAVRAAVHRPLVAIGGITLENARAVIDAGADVVAVARDLLAAGDIAARARVFLRRLDA